MFGSDVDFFGTHALRRRMALDMDKRKRIADTKAHLESLGREFDVKTIFLSKDVLFAKLLSRRHSNAAGGTDPLDLVRGQKAEQPDPLVEAAVFIVECDRLEQLPRLLKSMNGRQKKAVEEALQARSQRIREAEEPEAEAEIHEEAPETMPEDAAAAPVPETAE